MHKEELKDERYATMKKLVDSNGVTEFKELLVSFPRGKFAKDLSKNYDRINNCIDNTENFTIEEAHAISKLIEVEFEPIMKLMYTQFLNANKPKDN
jgi:hypothetical protein